MHANEYKCALCQGFSTSVPFSNLWYAWAARVTVLGLCVSLSVNFYSCATGYDKAYE